MKIDSGAHYKLQKVSIQLTSGWSRSMGEAGGGGGGAKRPEAALKIHQNLAPLLRNAGTVADSLKNADEQATISLQLPCQQSVSL